MSAGGTVGAYEIMMISIMAFTLGVYFGAWIVARFIKPEGGAE